MNDRRKQRDRTLDFLYAWAAIGPVIRLLLFVFIVLGAVWFAKSIVELALWIRIVLLG